MSPLPEVPLSYTSYSSEAINIRNFFERSIGPDESLKWIMGASIDKFEFSKEKGVVFSEPMEFFWNKDNNGKTVYSRVYSTNRKGVYLKIETDDVNLFKTPNKIQKGVTDYTFYRFGTNKNQEYIDSITNG